MTDSHFRPYVPTAFSGISLSERQWQALILASTAVALSVSIYCLVQGITIIFMHLFYFPIILLAYHYRYRGFLFAVLLALAYVWLVYFFDTGNADVINGAWLRFLVFAGIAAVVAYLSEHLSEDKKALQESERKYRTLFGNMLEGFAYCRMIYDTAGKPVDWVYLDVNAAFEQLTGLKDITGKRVLEAIPNIRELNPELFDIYGRVASTGISETFDIDFKPLRQWLKVSVFSPEKGYFVAVFEDITARKKAEEAVHAAVKLNQVVDQMSVSECMGFTLDEAERLTDSKIGFFHFINPDERTIQLIAWSTETKKHCFIPKEPDRNYPVSKAGVWVDCLRERKPVIHNDYASLPHKKGLPEGHVAVTRELVVPIFEEDKIVAIIGVGNKSTDYDGKDIDVLSLLAKNAWTLIQRKQTEEELQRARDFYLKILDDFPNPIWRSDINAKCDYFNKDWLAFTGRKLEQELGDGWAEGVHPDDFDRCLKIYLDNFNTRTPFAMEYRLRYHDGTYHWLFDSGKPFFTVEGKFAGYIGSCYDIQARKLAEEALHEVNRKLNLLSSITRHDIKNQLFSLKAFLELSKESLDDPSQLSEFLLKIERATNAIEHQIIFTKEYQDLGVKDPVWQDVHECIKDAQQSLPLRDIRIIKNIARFEIYADPLFEKVFYNLIDNALRYGGPEMTTIRISSQESGPGLVVSVEDNGRGISAEDRKHLFERGFGHNTGLGLFLSREILAITGITITETGEPGKGARFDIAVPEGAWRESSTPGE